MAVFILANENISIKLQDFPIQALLLEPHCLMKWVKEKKKKKKRMPLHKETEGKALWPLNCWCLAGAWQHR